MAVGRAESSRERGAALRGGAGRPYARAGARVERDENKLGEIARQSEVIRPVERSFFSWDYKAGVSGAGGAGRGDAGCLPLPVRPEGPMPTLAPESRLLPLSLKAPVLSVRSPPSTESVLTLKRAAQGF